MIFFKWDGDNDSIAKLIRTKWKLDSELFPTAIFAEQMSVKLQLRKVEKLST